MVVAIIYLLNNCYFTVGSSTFRQAIGKPMGSDPALFMANPYLNYFENKWILKLKKPNLFKARSFAKIINIIDDLYTTNDNGLFEKHFKEI